LCAVRPFDGASEPGDRPGCVLCGRPTFDPDKRSVPWARAAMGGRQVLVCPICQSERPDWAEGLDRCAACGGTRLSVQLGEVVCRACGHTEPGA
jgi:predicted amidophosphoribosyltransferase